MSDRSKVPTWILLLGLLVAPSPAAPEHEEHEPGAALWVWEGASAAQARFAARSGFDRLWVQPLPYERAGLRRLMRTARRRGLETWAMGGRSSWALDPGPMLGLIRRARRHGGYDGIVLDVEPYTLPEWDRPASRRRLLRSFLRGLERATRLAGPLPVLAAVPFWYDHDGYRFRGKSLLQQVLDRVDGVVVMAYRDRADGRDGILRLAGGEVRAAGLAGKQALIGVQTSPDELDKLGFAEEGLEAMRRELAAVDRALRDEPGYGGVAVHHYDSLRRLARH